MPWKGERSVFRVADGTERLEFFFCVHARIIDMLGKILAAEEVKNGERDQSVHDGEGKVFPEILEPGRGDSDFLHHFHGNDADVVGQIGGAGDLSAYEGSENDGA